MSLTARRTASWLLVLILLAAVIMGWQFAPGAGGLADEVRWLIRQPNATQNLNRAGQLLCVSLSSKPEIGRNAYMTLLFDDEALVRTAALQLLNGHLASRRHDDRAIEAIFEDWWDRTTFQAKLDSQQDAVWTLIEYMVEDNSLVRQRIGELRLRNRNDVVRLLLASTLDSLASEFQIVAFLFIANTDAFRANEEWLLRDLDYASVDELRGTLSELSNDMAPTAAGSAGQPVANIRIVDYLDDEYPVVRQAAGRILAVAGDVRGLPAFCEWLAEHPDREPVAKALMTHLFGPDWRTHCDGDDAESQPSTGG